MHRWTPEAMGRGRWCRRICLVVVVADQLHQAAVEMHHMVVVEGRLVISTSKTRKGWRGLDTPHMPFLTPLCTSLSLMADTLEILRVRC
jgi:hypothetical protein